MGKLYVQERLFSTYVRTYSSSCTRVSYCCYMYINDYVFIRKLKDGNGEEKGCICDCLDIESHVQLIMII